MYKTIQGRMVAIKPLIDKQQAEDTWVRCVDVRIIAE